MSKSLEQLAQEWLVISQHLDSHGTACFLIEELLAENERLEKIEAAAKVVWSGSELDGDISTVDTQDLRGLKAALEGGDERGRSKKHS